jgi:hypothetical protein
MEAEPQTSRKGELVIEDDAAPLVRVFPRRTTATPDDEHAYTTEPPLWAEANEVHVSVTWTYDLERAEQLAKEWERVAPVKIGGPATGMRGEDFTPGLYVKRGYVITSRGCPNKCWFCSVWKRDGTTRELPIHDGWNVLDDNLLACSEKHIREVFAMLKRQPRKAEFTGGLEAKILQRWHVELLADLKPQQMFFAYDTPDDYEPLVAAGKLLTEARLNRGHQARCYVLCGWPRDNQNDAEKRMRQAWEAGYFPYAMLWKNQKGDTDVSWRKWAYAWSQPIYVARMLRDCTRPYEVTPDNANGLFAANAKLTDGRG